MVSVPRDTPYEYNGKVEKINQMFAVNGALAPLQRCRTSPV